MFGIYRTILAILVLVNHFAGIGISSSPAVFGFYCLSGFLMTMLIDGDYRGRAGAFLLNRALRIYPLYWVTLILTIMIFSHPAWSLAVWFEQIFLGVRVVDVPYLIPIAFAVANEIVFYIAIAFGISRTLGRSIIWLAGSCIITAAVYLRVSVSGDHADAQADLSSLYLSWWCASLPFALGAVLFHIRERVRLPSIEVTMALLFCSASFILAAMFFCGYAYFSLHRIDIMMLGVYSCLVPQAILTLLLFRMGEKTVWKIDEIVGQYSYPLYLMQMLAFGLATNKLGMSQQSSPLLASVVLAISLVLSAAFLIAVDTPLRPIRKMIREERRSRWPQNPVIETQPGLPPHSPSPVAER